MSPTLSKLYLYRTLRMWKQKCPGMGIPIEEELLYTPLFADDQVTIAPEYDDVEYMFRKLREQLDRWGLKTSLEKTLYMICGDTIRDLILEDGTGTIKGCEEFEYL